MSKRNDRSVKNGVCSRRDAIKRMGIGSLALTGGALAAHAQKNRPNVVLIFSDDQGTVDANCYGSPDLYTPNMDRLAREGVRFTQFYVGAPVCSPSRASMLTGRYPQRAQLATNAWGSRGLPSRQVTIAEMLKDAGYKTAIFGKWHLGDDLDLSPTKQGFDEFFGHRVGCIDNYSHFFYWRGPNKHDLWRNDTPIWEDGNYFPDLIVREAKRYMTEHRDEPFFLYLPFNVPHYPLQGMEKYRKMYADMSDPRAMYAAFTSTLDEKIGEVVDTIDDLGIRDNTLIIFLSDHGHSEEERTFGGGGNNGPFRGHKFTLWEGGVRVPCIMSWPGMLPQNEVRGQAAMSIDIMPLIAHYCGVSLPNRKLDGCDIVSVVESASAKSPHDVMHWELAKTWAVREGDWKLVYNGQESTEDGVTIPQVEYFLSNLADDPSETNNLAERFPDRVARLRGLHEKWAEEVVLQ